MGEDELLGNVEISFDGHKLGRVIEDELVISGLVSDVIKPIDLTFTFETPHQDLWFNLMRAFGAGGVFYEFDRVSKKEVIEYFDENGMYN